MRNAHNLSRVLQGLAEAFSPLYCITLQRLHALYTCKRAGRGFRFQLHIAQQRKRCKLAAIKQSAQSMHNALRAMLLLAICKLCYFASIATNAALSAL